MAPWTLVWVLPQDTRFTKRTHRGCATAVQRASAQLPNEPTDAGRNYERCENKPIRDGVKLKNKAIKAFILKVFR